MTDRGRGRGRGRGQGALAVVLNTIVLAPALWLSEASPLALFGFVVLVSAFAWFEARGGQTLDVADGGFPWSALATALLTLALFYVAALTARPEPSLAWVVVGAAALALGVSLRHLAMAALGSSFVSEPRTGPRLVEQGVYRRMRHPSETGLLALTLGAGLLFASVAAVVVWALVFVPLVLARVRVEDRELRRSFGLAHVDYCRRVRALL